MLQKLREGWDTTVGLSIREDCREHGKFSDTLHAFIVEQILQTFEGGCPPPDWQPDEVTFEFCVRPQAQELLPTVGMAVEEIDVDSGAAGTPCSRRIVGIRRARRRRRTGNVKDTAKRHQEFVPPRASGSTKAIGLGRAHTTTVVNDYADGSVLLQDVKLRPEER